MMSKSELLKSFMNKFSKKKRSPAGEYEAGQSLLPTDHEEEPTDAGAQLGNGMRPMHNLSEIEDDDDLESPDKAKMMAEEESETPEDEEMESPEHQALEDEMGVEKHGAGKHLFQHGNGIKIMIALANKRKQRA